MKPRVLLIAEIGINHDGSPERAKILVDEAIEAGADQIKFQYRKKPTVLKTASELGNEILNTEIVKTYLDPTEINNLLSYCQSQGVTTGISFFALEDCVDFSGSLDKFDFFKIPSASNLNLPLMEYLLSFARPIYLSTGMLDESELEFLRKRYKKNDFIIPFHCISNYPTKIFNSDLSYLKTLQKKWRKEVGYSSHDDNLFALSKAIDLGITFLERHIAMSKVEKGLDKTSSSTPDEFRMIREYIDSRYHLESAVEKRKANQGEIINRQNLGYSLYATEAIKAGEKAQIGKFYERTPSVGVTRQEYIRNGLEGKILTKSLVADQPLFVSNFEVMPSWDNDELERLIKAKISIPVRFHDIELAYQLFPIRNFEFHLSYSDLHNIPEIRKLLKSNVNYSVHVPDYISSTSLLDVFSTDETQKEESLRIIENSVQLASKIQQHQGFQTPVVCSLNTRKKRKDFYTIVKELQDRFLRSDIIFLPQWLPPIAWYFGGSFRTTYMSAEQDIQDICANELKICLDFSHFLLSCNWHDLPKSETLHKLIPFIQHWHIAGAHGVDSEGTTIKTLNSEEKKLLMEILKLSGMKVMELWQGHLDSFSPMTREAKLVSKLIGQVS